MAHTTTNCLCSFMSNVIKMEDDMIFYVVFTTYIYININRYETKKWEKNEKRESEIGNDDDYYISVNTTKRKSHFMWFVESCDIEYDDNFWCAKELDCRFLCKNLSLYDLCTYVDIQNANLHTK